MQNPYIKNKLRSYQVKNLKEIFVLAIQEDQKQKIRALDFGATTSPGSANKTDCSINAIRNNGCFKCGSEEHFVKDCLLNQTDHDTHEGCKVAKNGDISSDKVMEPLSRLFTDLVEQIKLLMSSGHGSARGTPTCNTGHRQRWMGSYNGHGWQSNDQPCKREELQKTYILIGMGVQPPAAAVAASPNVSLFLIKENVMSPSKSTRRDSHFPFFVQTNCPSK